MADPFDALIDGPPRARAQSRAAPRGGYGPVTTGPIRPLAPVRRGAPPPRPPPPDAAPAAPPPRAAAPAPGAPGSPYRAPTPWYGSWSTLADTFSPGSAYRPPPPGKETLWDLPSAISHRAIPTTIDAATDMARGLWAKATDPAAGGLSDLRVGGLFTGQPNAAIGTPTLEDFRNVGNEAWNAARGFNQRYLGITRKEPYPHPQQLVSTAVQDPGGTGLDLGTLAEGGEGLAAKAGFGRTARVLGAAKYADPLRVAGSAAGEAARRTRVALRGGPVFDENGNFTPKARATIMQTAPYLKPEDLADPKFKQAMGDALGKGMRPASVREGLVTYHGTPAPRGPVTSTRPPHAAQPVTDTMIAQGKQAVAANAQGIAGAPVSDTVLGDTLKDAHDQAAAKVNALYQKADKQPGGLLSGKIGGMDFVDRLRANMTDALKNAGFSPTAMANLPGLAATNRAAGDLLDAAKNFGASGQISFPELEQLRRYGLGRDVPGMGSVDPTASKAMREGFDQTVKDHLASGFVAPGTPADAATNYGNARQAYADFQKTFGDGANPTVKRAIKAGGFKGPDIDPGDVDLGGGQAAAHKVLADGLVKTGAGGKLTVPGGGTKLYEDLHNDVFTDPAHQQALDDHIRQTVLATDPNTDQLLANPASVRDFLEHPLGMQTFKPEEATQLRVGAGANQVLSAAPTKTGIQAPSLFAHPLSRMIAGGVTGAALAPVLPALHSLNPLLSEGLATGVGMGVEAAGEQAKGLYDYYRAKAGAPTQWGITDPLTYGVQGAGLAAPGLSAAHLAGIQAPPPAPSAPPPPPPADQGDIDFGKAPRPLPPPAEDGSWDKLIGDQGAPGPPPEQKDIRFASGGRVEYAAGGHVTDMTARLMKRAEEAQKAAQSSTKPLLGLSDDTVAQALRVAQRGL